MSHQIHHRDAYLVAFLGAMYLGAMYAMVLSPTPVFAEEQQNSDLDELLSYSLLHLINVPITASSFFEESALDSTSNVTIIERQSWEYLGAQRLNDAIILSPSTISLPNFLGQSSIRIRGFAQSDARGIATLWDGVSITSFNLGTSDVDRPNIQLSTLNSIEVIRGPGSARYGSDAFHGVVALNSFESERDMGELDVRTASTGFYATSFNGSKSIGNNKRVTISAASSGQGEQNIEYQFPGGTSERDYVFRSNTLVLKLASKVDDSISYKLGLYYDDNDSKKFHGGGRPNITDSKDISNVDSKLGMYKFDLTYKLSKEGSIEFNSYYWTQKHKFLRPVTLSRDIEINGKEHRSEIQLVYKNKQFLPDTSLSAALSLRRDEIDFQNRKVFNSTTTFINSGLALSGAERKIRSLFIDTKTSFLDDSWRLNFGLRVDNYSKFGTQATPRLALVYRLSNDSVLKALYGNAFRAATAVEIKGTPFIRGNQNIKPEKLETYELVYLKQNESIKLEIVFFTTSWEDGITAFDSNGDGTSDVFRNTVHNSSKGIEVSFVQDYGQWNYALTASYTDSQNETSNQQYIAFPKEIINFSISYLSSMHWKFQLNNRLHLNGFEGPGSFTIKPGKLNNYWRTDLSIRKAVNESWSFYGNIRNLLNRRNFLPSLENIVGGIPEDEISLDIGVNFNI